MRRLATLAITAFAALALAAPAQEVQRIEKGQLVLEGVPETPAAMEARLQQYENVRSASFSDWAGDGAIYIATRFGETTQVHKVATPMGARFQLTFADEPVRSATARPGHEGQFLYSKDTGGDEDFQLYLFDEAAGSARRVTDGTDRHGFGMFSRDGRTLYWSRSNRRNAVYDVLALDLDTPDAAPRTLHSAEGLWVMGTPTADGAKALLFNYISQAHSRIYVLDLASGEKTEVNPSDTPIGYDGAVLSPDGTTVFYSADEGSEFTRLTAYDVASGGKRVLTADVNWDVEGITLSEDGRYLAYAVNAGGLSQLAVLDTQNDFVALAMPELPAGQIGGLEFSADGSALGFTLETIDSPGDAWSIALETAGLTRWTQSEIGGLDPARFIAPETIAYPTFDQVDGKPREIPAFLYVPAGEGPHPVVILIHGGPESQSRPGFSSTIQFWANELGIAVAVPNVRGSTGYGRSFHQLDNGRLREDSVKDIGALIDWLAADARFDADRIMVYGGSYGGYMVLASLVHFNDKLAGGVNIVGISSFVTFLENTAEYRRDLRRVEYGDERDPQMRAHLEAISPLNNVDRITKPLFVIHGANDPRVPASEAEQIVAAVRANGGEPWYMLAKDEGHGFAKKGNRDAMRAAVAMFFKQRLVGETPGETGG